MNNEDNNKPEDQNNEVTNEAVGSDDTTGSPTPEETPADGIEGGQSVEAPAEEAAPDTNVNDAAETDAAQEAHDVAEQVEPTTEEATTDAEAASNDGPLTGAAEAAATENVSLNITGEASLSVNVPAGTTVAAALKTAGINTDGLQLRDGSGKIANNNQKLDANTTLSATRKKSGG